MGRIKSKSMEEPDFYDTCTGRSYVDITNYGSHDEDSIAYRLYFKNKLSYEDVLFPDIENIKKSNILRHMRLFNIYIGSYCFLCGRQAVIFNLHFLGGLNVTDIALKLKLSKATITRSLDRAIRRIRRKLKVFYLDKRINPKNNRKEYAVVMGDCADDKISDCRVIEWIGKKRPDIKRIRQIENKYYEPYKYGKFKRS